MTVLQLFSKHAPNRVFIGICLGTLSGIASSMLIPVLMTALAPAEGLRLADEDPFQFYGFDVIHPKFATFFVGLCFVILIAKTLSQVLLQRVSLEVITKLRRDLYDRISHASISCLEQRSNGQLIQALSTDVQGIVNGAAVIPDLLVQASTLLGLLGLLCYLNTEVFMIVVMVILFGVVTFQLPMVIGTKYFARARDHKDFLQEGFVGLVDGAKELKLNQDKRKYFMEEDLLSQEKKILQLEKIGFTIVTAAANYGDLICFFAMGVVAFVFVNYHAISAIELTSVVMVLFYITGPIKFILNVLPNLARARVSLRKIKMLYKELPSEEVRMDVNIVPEWKYICLKSIFYRHRSSAVNGNSFSVGPIDTIIRRGEITFIVGGNGSGKSTISKVISLHYPASNGQITFDNEIVTFENINSFRQEIACIYSDYYLFKSLHNVSSSDQEIIEKISVYLDLLELKGKVDFSNGRFSTLKLSDGQKRRLALLVALLDNKALYVFDEWAADQDPHFKKVFYYEILPSLKAQGKAVVAISHDDRYFEVADQILTMEEGALK